MNQPFVLDLIIDRWYTDNPINYPEGSIAAVYGDQRRFLHFGKQGSILAFADREGRVAILFSVIRNDSSLPIPMADAKHAMWHILTEGSTNIVRQPLTETARLAFYRNAMRTYKKRGREIRQGVKYGHIECFVGGATFFFKKNRLYFDDDEFLPITPLLTGELRQWVIQIIQKRVAELQRADSLALKGR